MAELIQREIDALDLESGRVMVLATDGGNVSLENRSSNG